MRPIRLAAALAAACLLPTLSSAVDGTFTYVDKKILIRSQARAVILGSDMQVEGLAAQEDASLDPHRAVVFCYTASGTADKSDADDTKGAFSSVDLRLVIIDLFPISAPPGPTVIYDATITVPCKLKVAVKKAGAQASTRLSCDLGENVGDFPGLTPDLVDTIGEAFFGRKTTKLNAKSGKLKFTLNGEPTPEGVTPLPECNPPPPPPS